MDGLIEHEWQYLDSSSTTFVPTYLTVGGARTDVNSPCPDNRTDSGRPLGLVT